MKLEFIFNYIEVSLVYIHMLTMNKKQSRIYELKIVS